MFFVLVPEPESDLCTRVGLDINLGSQLVFGQKVDESQTKALGFPDIKARGKSDPVITDGQALAITVTFHRNRDCTGF